MVGFGSNFKICDECISNKHQRRKRSRVAHHFKPLGRHVVIMGDTLKQTLKLRNIHYIVSEVFVGPEFTKKIHRVFLHVTCMSQGSSACRFRASAESLTGSIRQAILERAILERSRDPTYTDIWWHAISRADGIYSQYSVNMLNMNFSITVLEKMCRFNNLKPARSLVKKAFLGRGVLFPGCRDAIRGFRFRLKFRTGKSWTSLEGVAAKSWKEWRAHQKPVFWHVFWDEIP